MTLLPTTSVSWTALIREVPDFPKPGILFRDITPLIRDPRGLDNIVTHLADIFAELGVEYVAGIESRGFIFAAPLALRLGVGFVPVRKPGKLPPPILGQSYSLEYGQDRLEISAHAFTPGARVALVDDLMATGGTALAAAELISQAGAQLCGFGFVIELAGLGGRSTLPSGIPVHSLVIYD